MRKTHIVLTLLATLATSTTAHATLISKLDGAVVYNDTLGITLLANANLLASNSFALAYNTDLGPHPSDSGALPQNYVWASGRATWGGAQFWIDALNDANYLGYNDWRLPYALNPDGSGPCNGGGCTNSELRYLFNTETDFHLFDNIQWSGAYWLETEATPNDWAWVLGIPDNQAMGYKGSAHSVWAVRSGDVPEPASLALLGLGFAGLMFSRQRKGA